MVAVPAALGVNVTEQVPAPDRVQLVAPKVPARPVAVNATEPAGAAVPAPLVSVTVAVHVEGWLMAMVLGLHTMVAGLVLRCEVMEPVHAGVVAGQGVESSRGCGRIGDSRRAVGGGRV